MTKTTLVGNLKIMSKQLTTSLLLLLTILLGCGVNGADICTCQPARFRVSIDLDLTCETSTIQSGNPGIDDAACTVQSTGTTGTPKQINFIEISELNQELKTVRTSVFNDTLTSGDTVRFASKISTSADDLLADVTARPRGVQAIIIGVDADGVEIMNKWVLLFSNDCSVYPVISIGQQIGWTKFENVIEPPTTLCTTNLIAATNTTVIKTTSSPTGALPDLMKSAPAPVAKPAREKPAGKPVDRPLAKPVHKPVQKHGKMAKKKGEKGKAEKDGKDPTSKKSNDEGKYYNLLNSSKGKTEKFKEMTEKARKEAKEDMDDKDNKEPKGKDNKNKDPKDDDVKVEKEEKDKDENRLLRAIGGKHLI